jgi:hypothetical protein
MTEHCPPKSLVDMSGLERFAKFFVVYCLLSPLENSSGDARNCSGGCKVTTKRYKSRLIIREYTAAIPIQVADAPA